MQDAILEIPLDDTPPDFPPSGPAAAAPLPPRRVFPGCLPDGTQLHLSAGIRVDLAAVYGEEFSYYYPQRQDEFATLLWMAAQPPAERGAAWRDPRPDGAPPLLSDFVALRATVSRWVDDVFRDSEADLVRTIALALWVQHDETRTVFTEKKAPAAAETAAA